MNTKIREFIGNTFYKGELKDANELLNIRSKEIINSKIALQFSFFNLIYSKETSCHITKSFINYQEINFIISLLSALQNVLNFDTILKGRKDYYKIAIISPYKAQVKCLTDKFLQSFPREYLEFIEINTIDSFQGREQDIVIISTVRSNSTHKYLKIGFLNDFRRMNVALSRAKFCCLVVGNSQTLVVNKYWNMFNNYCHDINSNFNFKEEKDARQENIEQLLKFGSLNKNNRKGEHSNEKTITSSVLIRDKKIVCLNKNNKVVIKKNDNSNYEINMFSQNEDEIIDLDIKESKEKFKIQYPNSNPIESNNRLYSLISQNNNIQAEQQVSEMKDNYFLYDLISK